MSTRTHTATKSQKPAVSGNWLRKPGLRFIDAKGEEQNIQYWYLGWLHMAAEFFTATVLENLVQWSSSALVLGNLDN